MIYCITTSIRIHSYKIQHASVKCICMYILLLRCVETPTDCADAVRSTHYPPGASFIDDNPIEIINEITRISQIPGMAMCAELINMLDCILTYPVCDADMERLRPICESQCEMMTNQLTQCLMSLPEGEFPLVTDIFSEVTCDDPESYYNFPSQYILDSTDNDECLRIGKCLTLS